MSICTVHTIEHLEFSNICNHVPILFAMSLNRHMHRKTSWHMTCTKGFSNIAAYQVTAVTYFSCYWKFRKLSVLITPIFYF